MQESWKIVVRGQAPRGSDSILFVARNFAEDLFDSGTGHNIIVLSRLCDKRIVVPATKFSITYLYQLELSAHYQMSQRLMVKVRYEQQMMPFLHGCCGVAFCRGA